MLLPFIKYENGAHSWELLSLFYQDQAGVPGYGAFLSRSRYEAKGFLASLSYTYHFMNAGSWFYPTGFFASLLSRSDKKIANDPQHPILHVPLKTHINMSDQRGFLSLVWDKERFKLQAKVQAGETDLAYQENNLAKTTCSRDHQEILLSSVFPVHEHLELGLKYLKRFHTDRSSENGGLKDGSRSAKSLRFMSHSYSFLWHWSRWQLYGQKSSFMRPATLWEEFGDGAEVVPAQDLRGERLRHDEFGLDLFFLDRKWQLHFGGFQDETFNKIVLIPAFGSQYKGVNLQHTRILGLEFANSIQLNSSLLKMSYTLLDSKNFSQRSVDPALPNLPRNSGVLSYSKKVFREFHARINARYRGTSFRDVENSIEAPPVITYNGDLDFNFNVGSYKIKSSLSVINIFNTVKIPVKSPYGSEKGWTSYSHLEGYPLPGRHWMMFLDFVK